MSAAEFDSEGLRQRNVPVQVKSGDEARRAVLQLNALEEKTANEQDKKTFGRTPNGTIFTVPVTHDMVSQLLSPTEPKNLGDMLVILVLVVHILIYRYSPSTLQIPVLGMIFLFWRAGYNIGIGWLLQNQSQQNKLVLWAHKTKLFVKPDDCPHPKLRAFVKRELETKIPKDYNFDTAPIEYNTWLCFRRVVDLILMCDFTSYVLFALACGRRPVDEAFLVTLLRWSVGIVLFAFNLWVKLDAHRVVKDYAWYWGDFFYLIDQELTFDGVFEMAPHPMYSIGYVGYYGISLMAASYKVLFVSIIAHAAQFAFLVWVENPHIEKTYNSPPPKQQINETPRSTDARPNAVRNDTAEVWPNPAQHQPSMTHNLLGLRNLDLYRTTDSSVMIISILYLALTLSSPNTAATRAMFISLAVLCRLWFSVGIGYLLNRQSFKKKWTRHFVKYGESTGEAWRQWKGTYHLSMVMCYASFVAAAWKMYTVPADWDYGLVLLKHVVGLGLVALQSWVSISIYDSLGEFGWFFGDFFFDQSPKLTYGGIYRFLNNPERVLGLAGVWGVALITNSKAMFAVALLSHTLSFAFIQLVERPHMQKLYGRSLRQDAGLVRSLRRSLPPPLRDWQEGMDKFLDETLDVVEEFLDAAKPKLAAGVNMFVKDTKSLLHRYPPIMIVPRFDQDASDLQREDYKLEIEGEPASGFGQTRDRQAERDPAFLVLEYGSPIRVKWTAPAHHSKLDWIGLYMVADNTLREVTRIPSAGRWIATNKGEYDTLSAEQGIVKSNVSTTKTNEQGQKQECMTGEMVFAGDKLWWVQGSFEFRYHHNGKHNVMAISQPFKISLPRLTEDDLEIAPPTSASASASRGATASGQFRSLHDAVVQQQIERVLLPVVQNCFERNYDYAPRTVSETYGPVVERDGKFARRVVYAILQMFGIEFAPEVVKADGKVENLAWRIWEAKKVLAPYSMSHSRGTSTPVEEMPKDM